MAIAAHRMGTVNYGTHSRTSNPQTVDNYERSLMHLRPTFPELEALAWRTGYTFAQAFLGGVVATGFTDLSLLGAAAVAGIAAAIVPVMDFVGKKLNG